MTIDLKKIQSIEELHLIFKQQLNFPDFYGNNWDAFWDSITGLVEMPQILILKNWDAFVARFPKDCVILNKIIIYFNKENNGSQIEFG